MDNKSLKIKGLFKLLVGQVVFIVMFYIPIGQVLLPISFFFIIFGSVQIIKKHNNSITEKEIFIKNFLIGVNIIVFLVIFYLVSRITG